MTWCCRRLHTCQLFFFLSSPPFPPKTWGKLSVICCSCSLGRLLFLPHGYRWGLQVVDELRGAVWPSPGTGEARERVMCTWALRGARGRCEAGLIVPTLPQRWGAPSAWECPEGSLPWHEGLLEGRLVDSCLRAHLLASAQFPLLCFRHVHRTSQVQDIGERFKLAFLLIKMRACIHFCWMCVSCVEWSCWVS